MKVRVVSTKDKNLAESQHAGGRLQDIIRRNRSSEALGLYAVCSAHPQVIAASAREAHENGSVLHVESTSSQVNQFGGYTGQNPEQFAGFVRSVAWDAGLSDDQVLRGGDHLGPFPWRSESASVAMDKACALVRACVLPGYKKIHLDASMPCADDPQPCWRRGVFSDNQPGHMREQARMLCPLRPRQIHCAMEMGRDDHRPAGLDHRRVQRPTPRNGQNRQIAQDSVPYSLRTDLPGWKLIPRAEPARSHAPRAPRQRSPARGPNTRRIGLAPRTSGSAELCLANGRPRAAIQPNSYL